MLGHASAAMTLDIYAGLFADNLDEVAERLNLAFTSLDSDQVRDLGGWITMGNRSCPTANAGGLAGGTREPPWGFEPQTYALRVRCSTTELRRPARTPTRTRDRQL